MLGCSPNFSSMVVQTYQPGTRSLAWSKRMVRARAALDAEQSHVSKINKQLFYQYQINTFSGRKGAPYFKDLETLLRPTCLSLKLK